MPDNDPRSRPRLGFIGLGAMGGRMARRLLAAGYDLTVHDRTRERARPLEQGGAKFAPTPKQVAAGADVVLSSLTDDGAVKDFGLVSQYAQELSVAMPSTAAAAQVCAVEHARPGAHGDEDFSAVIRTAQQMAGLADSTRGTEVPV